MEHKTELTKLTDEPTGFQSVPIKLNLAFRSAIEPLAWTIMLSGILPVANKIRQLSILHKRERERENSSPPVIISRERGRRLYFMYTLTLTL